MQTSSTAEIPGKLGRGGGAGNENWCIALCIALKEKGLDSPYILCCRRLIRFYINSIHILAN